MTAATKEHPKAPPHLRFIARTMQLHQPKSDSKSSTSSPPSSNPARIRDNQRRSRARRKEYVQELEAKLRRSEALGVQASVDIQTAARAVSTENSRLREEIARLKDENQGLKERLRTVSVQPPVVVADKDDRCCPTSPLSMAVVEPGTKSEARNCSRMPSAESPDLSSRTSRRFTQDAALHVQPSLQAPASSIPITRRSPQSHLQPQDPTLNDPSTHTYHPQTRPETLPVEQRGFGDHESSISDDTSSCEYAAHIITSMRADVSPEDVRADLGCGSSVEEWRECKVDNAKLFITMDRYTR